MGELLAQLRAHYREASDRASQILSAAQTEGRDMNESESARFEEATKSLRKLSEEIAVIQKHVEEERRLDHLRDRQGFGAALPTGASLGDFRDPDDPDIRGFLRGEKRELDVSLRGLQVVRNAHGVNEVRSLLESGGASPTVGTSFRSQLLQHLIANSAIRQVATVLTSGSGETLILPKTTAHPAQGTIVAEGAAINENDPSFGQGTLHSYKYANLIQVSTETLQDTSVDLEGYLAAQMGRALVNGSGSDMITGSGTSKPQGVLVGAGTASSIVGGTPAANGATFAELNQVFDGIIPPYQANGSWLVSQSALSKIRGLVNSQGTPLFQESLSAGTNLTMFGKPIVVDPFMPAVAVGGTSIAFGDFSTYYIRDVGVRFERSADYAFNTDLMTYRAVLRTDGRLLDTSGAISTYRGGTA